MAADVYKRQDILRVLERGGVEDHVLPVDVGVEVGDVYKRQIWPRRQGRSHSRTIWVSPQTWRRSRSELLQKVDEGVIALSPAVELSYLSEEQQNILLDAMSLNDCTPSHAQSIRMKKAAQQGTLSSDSIYEIMSEEKANQAERISFKVQDLIVAAKEARKIMIARYADSIGRLMRPGITLLFVTVAILGMIFGLFSFSEHPILCLSLIHI